jgi:hypothetical protein
MESIILREGVLNDDELYLSDEGKCFKGGFIAIIKYYTFLNSWCNTENVKKFRSKNSLNKFLIKMNYNYEN